MEVPKRRDKGPFDISVGQGTTIQSKMKMDARRKWKDPVKAKELGVLLPLRAARTWIREGFSGPKGSRNHERWTRYDNSLMTEA
jgi:hypothetical protein